ncbi:MAG TPA: efflux RND transporter periplasmic adaptor subunit [Thermoanaerobaculia bacterium]|jgi:HlyD family secretion protein|nr:efflux RND transporter periplasmic adaptor subunit [Thermoanaerobaculia bacterium]
MDIGMKTKKTMRAAVLLLLLSAPGAGIVACSRGETQEKQSATETAPVERRDLVITADASGQIEPLRVVEVKSRVGGEVQQIPVETGQELRQGTLIAMVDPRDVRNALSQAEADQALAQARVSNTALQRKRAESLARQGILSAQDLESTQLQETDARAQLVKARTNLQLAREKMGDVDIRAPISGTVIEKTVEQGQIIASASGNVSGGTTLVKMADLSTVRARALVDETDIGRVRPGQPATVTVEAYPGRPFRGTVSKIEPQAVVDQNVTMFPVLIELANPDRLLKPGMNAEVSVSISRRDGVVTVPNEAVVSPREAASAGAALGLDEQKLRDQMSQMRNAARGGRSGPEGAGAVGGPPNDRPRGAWGGRPGGSGGQRGPGGEGGRGSWRGGQGGGMNAGGAGGGRSAGEVQPGVVFVKGPQGPEPKFVLLGLSDWDHTEVIRGVEPGTQVYLISVARLKQQQTQFADRMRQRAGGGMFGGGNSGGGGGGQQGGGRGGPGGGGGPRGGQ